MLKTLTVLGVCVLVCTALASNATLEEAPSAGAAGEPEGVVDAASYAKLSNQFAQFHQNKVNILVHLIASPLGVVAALSFVSKLTKSGGLLPILGALYIVSLVNTVSFAVLLGTTAIVVAIFAVANTLKLGLTGSLVLLVLATVGQELSHYATGEKTFMSDYTSNGLSVSVAQLFYEHVYFLLPLCVDVALPKTISLETPQWLAESADSGLLSLLVVLATFVLGNYRIDSDAGWFPWNYKKHRALFCNLSSKESRGDLSLIRQWVLDQQPAKDRTSHWWQVRLEPQLKSAFARVALSKEIRAMFNSKFSQDEYSLDVLEGMNEIYVSVTQAKGTSDEVFFTRHVDGPWGLFPFGSCYRCIVGLDPNKHFTTHVPHVPASYTVGTGDALAFDFNREVHYITCDPSKIDENRPDNFRVILKIHYCVYPKNMWILGKILGLLNILYNMCFRALFLATIKPKTAWDRFMAFQVVFQTKVVENLQTHFGFHNVLYLAVLAFAAQNFDYRLFLLGTSFIHYARYITTYYHRKDVDYQAFKRDVLLFKTVAVAQLLYLFSQHVDIKNPDFVSLGMIAFGYTISVLATFALGMDRTYFGVELGFYEPKWITKFPYGVIPHPMIVGQCFALAGMYMNDSFRNAWPYLVPVHLLLYVTHMLQEVFDIHEKQPREIKEKDE